LPRPGADSAFLPAQDFAAFVAIFTKRTYQIFRSVRLGCRIPQRSTSRLSCKLPNLWDWPLSQLSQRARQRYLCFPEAGWLTKLGGLPATWCRTSSSAPPFPSLPFLFLPFPFYFYLFVLGHSGSGAGVAHISPNSSGLPSISPFDGIRHCTRDAFV